jgi:hypothetical protein
MRVAVHRPSRLLVDVNGTTARPSSPSTARRPSSIRPHRINTRAFRWLQKAARDQVDDQKQDRRQEVAEQLPEGLFHRCLPFIGYPAEVRLRLRPSGQVRSDVPLDYCHLDPASRGYSRIVRQIGRVGHLPLARRHLCVSAKRQSDEDRRKRSSGTESLRTLRWRGMDSKVQFRAR